jgi:hypothetical protein
MVKVGIKKLRELYQLPEVGLTSKKRFIENLHEQGVTFTTKDIDQLFEDEAIQVNAPAPKKFQRRHIIVSYVDDTWGADLVAMTQYKKYNDGLTYFLIVIDFLSKYAWVRPMVNAQAATTITAFQDIMKTSKRKPKNLNTDAGSEFRGDFKKWVATQEINHYESRNETKVPIAERFIRTLKMRVSRFQDQTGSYRYVDNIQKIVDGYNKTVHSTIKMTPTNASLPKNYERLIENFRASQKRIDRGTALFSVGDTVRIAILKNAFTKESDGQWSVEKFKVVEKKDTWPWTYRVADLKGEDIDGSFYEQELLKTS